MVICSLFAGIGGIDLAFKQSGFEGGWANEFDRDGYTNSKTDFIQKYTEKAKLEYGDRY